MEFIIFIFKILLLLAAVFVMMAPLLSEYLSFRRDREKGITHKRFRLLVFALVYCAVLTVLMVFLKDLLKWVESWNLVKWLVRKLAIRARTVYSLKVTAVMIINFAVGACFRILLPLVRIGLKKKDLSSKAVGAYTWAQKIERKILAFFYDEKWFFAGMILKYLCLSLVGLYAAVFLLYLLPVLFGADWIPYGFAKRLLEAGYLYPILTLLPLCEAYYFLAGVELLEKECPEFSASVVQQQISDETDVDRINTQCKNFFKDYFSQEIKAAQTEDDIPLTEHHPVTDLIARSIEANSRNPKLIREGYLKCLDTIVKNDIGSQEAHREEKTKGVLVNGSFFTGFSEYFMRYISVILARGDNVIFVCNDHSQIEQTYERIVQSLNRIYSLYQATSDGKAANFDHPVWKVQKASGDCCELEIASVNNCSVLVADPNFLTTSCFEEQCDTFIHLVDTVVFVNTLNAVNVFARQMSVFDAKVKNMREQNATRAQNSSEIGKRSAGGFAKDGFSVRYSGHQIKYICFDDSRVPGLDKVLKNLLFVDFESADAMRYSPQTVLCCYNFEARKNEKGKREQLQLAHTEEDLSVLINMADFAVKNGSEKVTLFAEQNMPFRDLAESVDANANHGLDVRNGVNLLINNDQYDLDDCRVIIAFDHDDNLPMTVRRMRTVTTDQKTLVMVFSRPYLFRDYYLSNIEKFWMSEQMMRIPTEQTGRHSALQKILVKAGSGGIAIKEIFDILADTQLEDYSELLSSRDTRGVLRKILVDCGKHCHEALNWNDYFEFVEFSDFNSDGDFLVEERVCLRNKRVLGSLLDGVSPAKAVIDNREISLPIPKNRITQNYIVGQNLLYDGCVYVIKSIDVKSGKIFVKHATGGFNAVPYRYVQNREYHIDFSNPDPERVYPTLQVELAGDGEIPLNSAKISVTRRPLEVITKGYSCVDYRTLNDYDVSDENVTLEGDEQIDLFKQTYRRYGEVKEPVCSSEAIMKSSVALDAFPNDALVMSIKLSGEFAFDSSRMLLLASVMLNEVLRAMFPSVADAFAVCPVLDPEAFDDEESLKILKKLPKAFCRELPVSSGEIELLIIEDCATDLGVVSVLMSSGDDVLKMLFKPVYEYLEWYTATDHPSNYLNFGLDAVPNCFDFENLSKLASVLGKDEFQMNFVEVESVAQYDVCDFCGKRYPKGKNVVLLEDGRKMCRECANALVDNNKKVLKAHLDRAKIFLESTYGITLEEDYEFCFESTLKIANSLKQNKNVHRRGADVPLLSYVDDKKKVHVECTIPSVNLSELLVRELTHVWQLKHLPGLEEDLAEGHIALVAVQYLRFLNQIALASVRTTYYETTANLSGEGYRKLVKALLEKPQYSNNPFLYLLGEIGGESVPTPEPIVIEEGELGKAYVPEQPDRVLNGEPAYFYYERLAEKYKKLYDLLLPAIRSLEESVPVAGYTQEEITRVSEAIEYDHPELFWFGYAALSESGIVLKYRASAEEIETVQRRIDEAVPGFLEGIDDTMSAYDVLLRLHVKVISKVDYDTIALNKEEAAGYDREKIDSLRSIYGVFVEGKAVCEGYARAMQYLLQKCGIECAEAAGYILKENGENGGGAHAWNIVKIDGDYYYLDTTWDDSSNTIQTVKKTGHAFDYFCITTEELTRTRDLSLCPTDLPVCVATRANYYYHNDCVLDTYDLDRIKEIARTAAKNKGKFFTFKCKTRALYEETLNRLCVSGTDCYVALKAASKEDKRILSDSYTYTSDQNIRTVTVKFKYK